VNTLQGLNGFPLQIFKKTKIKNRLLIKKDKNSGNSQLLKQKPPLIQQLWVFVVVIAF